MYAIKKSGMLVAFPENKTSSNEQINQSQMTWYEIICIIHTVPVHLKLWQSILKLTYDNREYRIVQRFQKTY